MAAKVLTTKLINKSVSRMPALNLSAPDLNTLIDAIYRVNAISGQTGLPAEFNKFLTQVRDLQEEIIAANMGASRISGVGGKGLVQDLLVLKDSIIAPAEVKNVQIDVGDFGEISRARKVSLGTITLTPGTKKSLATGIGKLNPESIGSTDFTPEQALTYEEVDVPTRFINKLESIKNGNNKSDNLKKYLNSSSYPIAAAIRKNIELKAADIRILYKDINRSVISSIGWTWKDIVKNQGAQLSIKSSTSQKGQISYIIDIKFSEASIRKAMNEANKKSLPIVAKLNTQLLKKISKTFAYLSPEVRKFLNTGVYFQTKVPKGSVYVYSANITAKYKDSKKSVQQRFISGAQWTALTQQRLGQTMQRFGPPDPPDLKERSGRFRSSVEVSADYRRKLLQYTYNPLYQSLEQYGYRPDIQVQRAIREVAQSLYTQKFNIRRV